MACCERWGDHAWGIGEMVAGIKCVVIITV
jgi:hypothetical protein